MSSEVTVVVVPRDHFSHAEVSLESILACTRIPYELVYVDHSAPPEVSATIERVCRQRGFQRIGVDRPLSPNEARNQALSRVRTPFVVFVDNDVVVAPGWLEALVETARQTGAWLVGPSYLVDVGGELRVHLTGGTLRFHDEGGSRRFEERHLRRNAEVSELEDVREPEPTELLEFHCLLARTEVFDRLGPLDEALLAHGEHLDLCLNVREAGGTMLHEPRSRVTIRYPERLLPEEVPYYLLRWGPHWSQASIDHFAEKWGISPDDPYRRHIVDFVGHLRRRMLGSVRWPLGRISELLVHRRGLGPLVEPLVARLEARATRPLVERRSRAA